MTTPATQAPVTRKLKPQYPDYMDDPEGLERFRDAVRENSGHDMAALNHNSLGRLIDTIDRLVARQASSLPGDVGAMHADEWGLYGIGFDSHTGGFSSIEARKNGLETKETVVFVKHEILAALTPSALSGDAGEGAFQAGFSAGFSEGMNEGMPGHKPVFCDDAWKAYVTAHQGAGG